MIEAIDHGLHPYNTYSETNRYFVVFWSERDGAWAETQALVQSTENDVAEVHAWATREMANPEINAKFFQLHAVVPDAEGEWALRLTGGDDPTMGEWVELSDEPPSRTKLGPLTNWLVRLRERRANARLDDFDMFQTQRGAQFVKSDLAYDEAEGENTFVVRVWGSDPGKDGSVTYRGSSPEGAVQAIDVVDALEFADAATRLDGRGRTAQVGVLVHGATNTGGGNIVWIWGENPLA